MPPHGFLTALLLALLALLAGNGGCTDAQFTLTTDFSEKHAFEAGRPLAVDWTNGEVDVRVDPSVKEIHADGQIKARASNEERAREMLDDTRVEFAMDNGRLVVKLKHPKITNGGVSADVHVRIPAGAPLEIDAINGQVSVTGNTETLDVDTNNGQVRVSEQRGDVDIETINGGIDVRSQAGNVRTETTNGTTLVAAVPSASEAVHCRAVNGSVNIQLPRGTAANIDVNTVNGSIKLDAGDAKVSESAQARNRRTATINGGGAKVDVGTTNGSVSITLDGAAKPKN